MLKKIIIFVIFAALAGAVFWYAYPVVKERYFNNSSEENLQEAGEKENSTSPAENSGEKTSIFVDTGDDSETEDETTGNEQPADNIESSYKYSLDVSVEDCDNECENYSDNGEGLEYCRQTCGLAEKASKPDSCEEKSGLEKDYCWKDEAADKSDFEICKKIRESGIRQTCYNRLTEEFIDESMSGEENLEE